MNKIKILIVDDHAIVRMGLASLIGTRPELEVVGDTGNGEDAVRKAARLKPDIILLDMVMPGMDGAETTRRLIEADAGNKILILTSYGSSDGIAHALEAGALGAVIKTLDFKELLKAIKEVAAGKKYISKEMQEQLSVSDPISNLSPRQNEILHCLARGLNNSDIAALLGISRSVVREHEMALYAKIGAANRTEAVTIALRKHLLKV
jgi:NarL family two-component system response regulator LiaR